MATMGKEQEHVELHYLSVSTYVHTEDTREVITMNTEIEAIVAQYQALHDENARTTSEIEVGK